MKPPLPKRQVYEEVSYDENELKAVLLEKDLDIRDVLSLAPSDTQNTLLLRLSERSSLSDLLANTALYSPISPTKPRQGITPTPEAQFYLGMPGLPAFEERLFGEAQRFVREMGNTRHRSSMLFSAWTSVLDTAQNVDLRTYAAAQDYLNRQEKRVQLSDAMLEELHTQGKLLPIPEIHWRVDRTPAEYARRLGVDITGLLDEWAKPEEKKLLLELGPGNGTFRKTHGQDSARKNYIDMALCNAVYYPTAPLIQKSINFTQLEQDIDVTLTEEERTLIAEVFSKVLVIREGDLANDRFAYDTQVQKDIAHDAASLFEHLHRKAQTLPEHVVVPSTISTRDDAGNVIYPYKVGFVDQSEACKRAFNAIRLNMSKYLQKPSKPGELFDHIPAHAAGTIIGDLDQLDHLKDDQISVALDTRCTVYKKGDEFVKLVRTLGKKLETDGIAILDSARDNDGWYYRLAELMEAKRTMHPDMELFVITGPGFKGEDVSQDPRGVPLAFILSRSAPKIDDVRSKLLPADAATGIPYRMHRLEDLCADESYLATLDTTGLTRQRVEQVQAGAHQAHPTDTQITV